MSTSDRIEQFLFHRSRPIKLLRILGMVLLLKVGRVVRLFRLLVISGVIWLIVALLLKYEEAKGSSCAMVLKQDLLLLSMDFR